MLRRPQTTHHWVPTSKRALHPAMIPDQAMEPLDRQD
jgi:hypothetical protein